MLTSSGRGPIADGISARQRFTADLTAPHCHSSLPCTSTYQSYTVKTTSEKQKFSSNELSPLCPCPDLQGRAHDPSWLYATFVKPRRSSPSCYRPSPGASPAPITVSTGRVGRRPWAADWARLPTSGPAIRLLPWPRPPRDCCDLRGRRDPCDIQTCPGDRVIVATTRSQPCGCHNHAVGDL